MKERYTVSLSHIILICLSICAYVELAIAENDTETTTTPSPEATTTTAAPLNTTAGPPTTTTAPPTTTTTTTTKMSSQSPTSSVPPGETIGTSGTESETTEASTTINGTSKTAVTTTKASSNVSTNTTTIIADTTPTTKTTAGPANNKTTILISSTANAPETTTVAPSTTRGNVSLTSQTSTPPGTSALPTIQSSSLSSTESVTFSATDPTVTTKPTTKTTAESNSSVPTTSLPPTSSIKPTTIPISTTVVNGSTSTTRNISTNTTGNVSLTSQTSTPPHTTALSTTQSSSLSSTESVTSSATDPTVTTKPTTKTTAESYSSIPTTSLPPTSTIKPTTIPVSTTVVNGSTSTSQNISSSTINGNTSPSTSGTTSQSTNKETSSTNLSTTTVQTSTPDPCAALGCLNEGSCVLVDSTATCKCVPGYSGATCETNINECSSNPCKNGGTCQDDVNMYTCNCQPGFNGTLCENNIDDCIGNPCENGGTCSDGNNTFTCQCSPGYKGDNCSVDIDECEDNPCENGANCTDLVNSYICHCVAGFTGSNCSADINECESNPCENGATCNDMVNMYNCTCVPGYNGTNCEQDIDDCVGEKCRNNGTCNDRVNNFTCSCTTGWRGYTCTENIDECKENTHNCDRNANCTDFDGGFHCTCWTGFTGTGVKCDDINECEGNVTRCLNNATCVNTPGDYRCVCGPGWTGNRCSENIDECKDMSPCADNALCTDTEGSYTCKCKDGYRGDGINKCVEEVLIAVEHVTKRASGDDEIFGPFSINNDLSFFGQIYNKFYVSINGYITLGNTINETYPPTSSDGWNRFDTPIIAPLWADIEACGPGGGVQITNELTGNDLGNIAKLLQEDNLNTGIVVTWKKAVPYPYKQNANFEEADFQVVIGATESKTYVMFNYDQEIFTWKTFPDRNVAAGYYYSDTHKRIVLDSSNFTSANMKNFTSDIKGRWIFNATSASEAWKEKSACIAAVSAMKIDHNTDTCPCTVAQASRDSRFKFNGMETIKELTVQQYVPRFKQQQRTLCHYNMYGSLLKGHPGGGYFQSINATNAYNLCCPRDSTCNLFYQANPSDTCSGYSSPTWSLSWGDPHLTTFDGMNYTFNGRGEYTLLSLEDNSNPFKVQVRTEHIDSTGYATIFTGLAAQEGGKTKIEVLLNKTSQSADIYIDNFFNTTFPKTGIDHLQLEFDNVSINSNNKTIEIVFKSKFAIRVEVSDILAIVTSVPKDEPYKGNIVGLLGNNNGDSKDDFKLKNGTVLLVGSNEKALYDFGHSWMVSSKNDSLFGYYDSDTNGKNFSFFNNQSNAKPGEFIADAANFTDILISKCNNSQGLNLSHCHGNKACIVDTIGSCKKDFGEKSLNTEEKAIKDKQLIDHMPPDLKNLPAILYVGYSQNTSVKIPFTQNNSQVTCKTNIKDDEYKCGNTMFSWNVSQSVRTSTVNLTIMATDSLNTSSEYQPKIYYCGCENGDQCDFSLIQIDGPVKDNFYRARCVCPETRNGSYCQGEVNICDRNPCFENVTCNGTLENPCGPCPKGLTGDGVKCYDVDECRTNQSKCEQICENTIGNYMCKCNKGYEKDGYTCKDIDECSRNASYCVSKLNTYCMNEEGSADCLCLPGYTNRSGQCINVKEKSSYAGILVFKTTTSVSREKLKAPMTHFLADIFNTSSQVYLVEIVSFSELTSLRNKRDISSNTKYEMKYIVHMKSEISTENLQTTLAETFNKYGQTDGYIAPKLQDLNAVVWISTTESRIVSDEAGGICSLPGSVTCDIVSTTCISVNGTYSCRCKEGFDGWENPYTSCKDVDECSEPRSVCIGGKDCNNYPGSYLCECEPGFKYVKPNCVDMCDSRPCQNGGQCIHGETEGMYMCKCDDNWTGPNCEEENAEAEKLKIIAIAVGASVGAVCLLLLFGLCGMYRRYRNRYSGYRRRPLSSMDFDSSFGLSGPTIRTKDFPIDDDTDTAFSIPRPKYTDSEYGMNGTNATSLTETAGNETGKLDEPKSQLTKVTKESYSYGSDNPSFLHSEGMEAARRSFKRESKSAYDYF